MTNQHGILAMVARVEGGPYFTVFQIAQRVGRSKETVQRWINEGSVPEPTTKMDLGVSGKQFVWLFSEEDVQVIEAYASYVRPGRPRRKS